MVVFFLIRAPTKVGLKNWKTYSLKELEKSKNSFYWTVYSLLQKFPYRPKKLNMHLLRLNVFLSEQWSQLCRNCQTIPVKIQELSSVRIMNVKVDTYKNWWCLRVLNAEGVAMHDPNATQRLSRTRLVVKMFWVLAPLLLTFRDWNEKNEITMTCYFDKTACGIFYSSCDFLFIHL